MGRVVCANCGKFFGYCSEVEATLTEGKNSWGFDSKSTNTKRSKTGREKFKSRPFLKAKDLPAKGATFTILEFRAAPKQMEYSDFLCDIKNGTKEYTLGLREGVLLDMLIDELGAKTEKWANKKVRLVKAGPKGQYINVG